MLSNYSSEYIEDLKGTEEEDTDACIFNTQHIRESVRFRLPDSGIILNIVDPNHIDQAAIIEKMPSILSHMKLPYDNVVLEYAIAATANNPRTSMMIMAHNNNDKGILFRLISKHPNNGVNHWHDFRAVGHVNVDFKVEHMLFGEKIQPLTELEEMFVFYSAYVILSFVAALECSNVVERLDKAPPKLNKSRIKKGKEPLFDYKTLVIETKGKKVILGAANGDNEPSHTKREHLRRGHIRRYEHKTIWINPSLVGDSSKGSIKKDYTVR